MTSLETRITTYPALPGANVTPLERLILSSVLHCSDTEEGLVLFTDTGPMNPIRVERRALIDAFHASRRNRETALGAFLANHVLADLPPDDTAPDSMVEVDLSAFPWQFIAQDIIARSATPCELVVIQWICHPSQRPDTFGASVSLITANGIHHATSEDLLAHFRRQDRAPASTPPVASQDDGSP